MVVWTGGEAHQPEQAPPLGCVIQMSTHSQRGRQPHRGLVKPQASLSELAASTSKSSGFTPCKQHTQGQHANPTRQMGGSLAFPHCQIATCAATLPPCTGSRTSHKHAQQAPQQHRSSLKKLISIQRSTHELLEVARDAHVGGQLADRAQHGGHSALSGQVGAGAQRLRHIHVQVGHSLQVAVNTL